MKLYITIEGITRDSGIITANPTNDYEIARDIMSVQGLKDQDQSLSRVLEGITDRNKDPHTDKILSIITDQGELLFDASRKPNFYIKYWANSMNLSHITKYNDSTPIYDKSITEVAQEIFLLDLNVMMQHGKDSDILWVDDKRFQQR